MANGTSQNNLLGINGFGRIGKLSFWNHLNIDHFDGYVINVGRKVGKSLEDLLDFVSIDSTLGLEALARGLRVVFISRKPELKLNSASFGWPYKFKNEGFFWTNLKKRESFNKILENVTTCSDATWIEQAKPYIDNIIHHDYGNKRFNDLISKLLK